MSSVCTREGNTANGNVCYVLFCSVLFCYVMLCYVMYVCMYEIHFVTLPLHLFDLCRYHRFQLLLAVVMGFLFAIAAAATRTPLSTDLSSNTQSARRPSRCSHLQPAP